MLQKMLRFILISFAILVLTTGTVYAEETQKSDLIFSEQMTFQQLADANGIDASVLLSKLGLNETNAMVSIKDAAGTKFFSVDTVRTEAKKLLVEKQVEGSRNWKLIFAKFLLWVLLISTMAFILQRRKTVKYKLLWLGIAAMVFGVILGSDPNPLGVVKDGIVLYANEGVLFKPRFVALGFLLLLVVIFSRIFCGWACQIGTVQELLYRFPVKKLKLPFWFTNLIRVLVFAGMIVFAFGLHRDILGYIDPFKIYMFEAANYTFWLAGFSVLMFTGSLFIYRPWCTLACPFGLLAWVVNKASFLKMRFDHRACEQCGSCSKICPTGAVKGLKSNSGMSDCFMCNRCQEVCPTSAISYGRAKKAGSLFSLD